MGHHMRQAAWALLLGVVAGGIQGCSGGGCEVDIDCGSGFECVLQQCQPVVSTCANGAPACTDGNSCQSGRCEDGCCVVPCFSAADCADGEVCRSGVCRERETGCTSDAACFSPTGRCHLEKAICVACLTPADCGDDGLMTCSTDNRCVLTPNRCTVSGDCTLGLTCQDTFCKPPPTGCTSDAGCSGQFPRCQVDSGQCVGCLANDHCSSDGSSVCNLASNTCEAVLPGCGSDAACAAPVPYCRTEDRTCVQCQTNEHCGPDASCEDNVCVPLGGCSSDAACDMPLPHCRTEDRTCVQCLETSQCGEGKVCTDNICLPAGGCDEDLDCPFLLPHCRTADRACVLCVEDDHCEWDETCEANVCERLPGCSWDDECPPATPVCRDEDRTCVGCLYDEDCVGGICEDNVCRCGSDTDCGGATPACHPVSGECVECSAAFPCAPGYRCWTEGVCEVIEEQGIPCADDLDCREGLACVGTTPENGRCLPECSVYESPSRCPADTVCSRVGWRDQTPVGACVPDAGLGEGALCSATQTCRPDLECVPDSATTARCRATCDLASPGTCTLPNACRRVVELDANNVPRTYGLCYPLTTTYLNTCDTTAAGGELAGCQSWQVCARGPERDEGTRLSNICRMPNPGAATGLAGCSVDADCHSGYCVRSNPLHFNGPSDAGHCQQACTSDDQCPAANGKPGACTLTPVDWFDAAGEPIKSPVAACVPQCAGELDCRPGDTCVAQLNFEGTKWITRCLPAPHPLGGLGGARCTDDAQCRSGTCLQNPGNPTDGICLGACATDADCASGYGFCDFTGVLLPVSGEPVPGVYGTPSAPVNVCWGGGGLDADGNRQCESDADCFSLPSGDKPRVCVERRRPPEPGCEGDLCEFPLYNCMPATGDVAGGGTCLTDADCASGRCIEWKSAQRETTERRCMAPCVSRADCAADPVDTACRYVWRPGSYVQACVPAFCAEYEADCQEVVAP